MTSNGSYRFRKNQRGIDNNEKNAVKSSPSHHWDLATNRSYSSHLAFPFFVIPSFLSALTRERSDELSGTWTMDGGCWIVVGGKGTQIH
jgi:hypothetical protein